MENAASSSIKATLLIKQAELDFVVKLLDALKLQGIVEFIVEDDPVSTPSTPPLTAKKLNDVIEKSEKSADIPMEAFKKKHQL